jgi:serine/threonine protein kinase
MHKLGDYTLTRPLGAGGMGQVWMGRRETLGAAREVAIKTLTAGANPEARRMFLDEARLSMLLRNSNIVQVHDVAETEDKTCYMVMEYVEGLNLSELEEKMRQAGESMPDSMAAFIIGEVLKGLAHAHELRDGGQPKTVVHRDVSPHNVMLSIFGEVKIMDFGIARVASEDTSGVHVKGKVRYMPPEQLRGESREPTLDLFAVGAMLHELLDQVKFRSNVLDEARLYGMVLDGEIPKLQRANDTIPRELDELRLKLLASKPSDRVQTAREAFRRLTCWPGYRDTRFELDELVRRYVGQVEPQPAIAPTNMFETPLPRPAAAPASMSAAPISAGSVTGAEVIGPERRDAAEDRTVTDVLSKESSETDVARARSSGTNTATTSRSDATPSNHNRSKVLAAALALVAFASASLSVAALLGVFGDDDDAQAKPEREPETVARIEEPSTPVEPAPVIEPTQPSQPAQPVITPPETQPTPEDTIAPDSDAVDVATPPDPPTASPEPTPPEPTPEAVVTKVKATISLGKGVGWAEVKIGGRTIELDGFSGTASTSTKLRPGSQSVSCRTEVDGPFKPATRIEIPDRAVKLFVQKDGTVTVE